VLTGTASSKVTAAHLSRTALLYVRQSSLKQVLHNTSCSARPGFIRDSAGLVRWTSSRAGRSGTALTSPCPDARPRCGLPRGGCASLRFPRVFWRGAGEGAEFA
jgi:hypothetical protein